MRSPIPERSLVEVTNVQEVFTIPEGSLVEVTSQEVGLLESFYQAIVLGHPTPDTYRVQYTTLWKDDWSAPLVEVVPFHHVRPVPPQDPRQNPTFKVLDVVDAYDRDGWWEGVITKKLTRGKYVVYFELYKCELEYPGRRLRLHHEWENRSWRIKTPPGCRKRVVEGIF